MVPAILSGGYVSGNAVICNPRTIEGLFTSLFRTNTALGWASNRQKTTKNRPKSTKIFLEQQKYNSFHVNMIGDQFR